MSASDHDDRSQFQAKHTTIVNKTTHTCQLEAISLNQIWTQRIINLIGWVKSS